MRSLAVAVLSALILVTPSSGVVVDPDGYMLTNNHVIANAQ